MTSGVLARGRRIRLIILFVMAAILAAAVAIVVTTDDEDEPDLVGEMVSIGPPTHTDNPADLQIPTGDPPAGGPHFRVPLAAGIYEQPVADGGAIHSLEHGMVWITYNPRLASASDIAALRTVAQQFSRDVLLSPRPDNSRRVTVLSWGRILRLDRADAEAIGHFIEVNRDRSPEPGIR